MHRFLLFAAVWAVAIGAAAAAEGDPRLFAAVRQGDVKFLKEHLDQPSLGARDRRGATLLMHAAAFGNVEILKLLLDAGADVNARNDFDATALLWGARDPEKSWLLIERGANVNARSKQGRTPLMLASLRPGGSETVALMLEKGADPKVKDGRGDTALGLAATIGEVETMRLLLAKGADPAAANNKGERPIILATKSKCAEAVSLLLQEGVDVNVASTSFNIARNGPIAMIKLTPLHRAAAFGPVQMVRDLLKADANVNAHDGRSLTPLHFAVATEYPSQQICEALLQAGADVNARDNTGETPLDWAEKFAYPEIVQTLRKASAKHGDIAYEAPTPPNTPRPQPPVALARSEALLEKSKCGILQAERVRRLSPSASDRTRAAARAGCRNTHQPGWCARPVGAIERTVAGVPGRVPPVSEPRRRSEPARRESARFGSSRPRARFDHRFGHCRPRRSPSCRRKLEGR